METLQPVSPFVCTRYVQKFVCEKAELLPRSEPWGIGRQTSDLAQQKERAVERSSYRQLDSDSTLCEGDASKAYCYPTIRVRFFTQRTSAPSMGKQDIYTGQSLSETHMGALPEMSHTERHTQTLSSINEMRR